MDESLPAADVGLQTTQPSPTKKRKTNPSDSVTSKATAASGLAISQTMWNEWAIGAGIFIDMSDDETLVPDEITTWLKILGNVPQVLKSLTEGERAALPVHVWDRPVLAQLFTEVDDSSRLIVLEPDISSQLVELTPLIVLLCHTLQVISLRVSRTATPPSEAEWRRPSDDFLFRIFEMINPLPRTQCLLEFSVSLPYSTSQYSPKTAILDSAVISYTDIGGAKTQRSLLHEASCTESVMGMYVPTLHWVTEYKKESDAQGFNQLVYGLAAAQYQRSAMGFKNQVVCGAAITKSIATVCVSWWQKRISHREEAPLIYIRSIAEFNLLHPLDAVRFTVFLLNIRSSMKELEPLFNGLTGIQLKEAQEGTASWKASMAPPSLPGFATSQSAPNLPSGSGDQSANQTGTAMMMQDSSSDVDIDKLEPDELTDEDDEDGEVEVVDTTGLVKSWVDTLRPHVVHLGQTDGTKSIV